MALLQKKHFHFSLSLHWLHWSDGVWNVSFALINLSLEHFIFHLKVSGWIFFHSCFNRSLTCPYLNNTTGEDAFCCVLTSKYDNTICWDPFPEVTSQCVYVHLPLVSSLTTESVTNGCVRAWWSTAIALLGTKLLQDYIDSSKKSCFNQPHIIWEMKKDVQLLIEEVKLSFWRKIVF